MNKKAIIFTIDALIALSIFTAVIIAMYSIMTPHQTINLDSASIYAVGDNFLQTMDKSEKISKAFKTGNYAELTQEMTRFPYNATLRFYKKDYNGDLILLNTINNKNYTNSIILRKFLVLSIQGINVSNSNCTSFTYLWGCEGERHPNDTLQGTEAVPGSGIIKEPFDVTLFYDKNGLHPYGEIGLCDSTKPGNSTPPQVNVTVTNGSAFPTGWLTQPSRITINYTNSNFSSYWTPIDIYNCTWYATFHFNLSINTAYLTDNDLGNHTVNMTMDLQDQDPPCMPPYYWICTDLDQFHLLRYGFVELEVETP